MKIAIPCFNLGWMAGGPRLIFHLARELTRQGHAVAIFAPDFDQSVYPELSHGLDIRSVSMSNAVPWSDDSRSIGARIRRKVMQERRQRELAAAMVTAIGTEFDAVIIDNFAYIIARDYARKNPRARLVWMMHDPPFHYLPKTSFLYDLLSRFFNTWKEFTSKRDLRPIHEVAVVNQSNYRWAVAHGLHATITRPGVDSDEFGMPAKTRTADQKSITLCCLGAPNKYRRFEDPIRAVALLRRRGYDARAVVAGKNIWKEDAYVNELRNLIAAEHLEDAVSLRFEGLSSDEVHRLYAASDVFVLPIHLPPPRNGFSWQLTAFEPLAAGIPLIISRRNDSVEVLRDGETALFVDPCSPEQIAEKVAWLVDHPHDYTRIAAAGQRFVREELTWKKYADAFARLIVPREPSQANGAPIQ